MQTWTIDNGTDEEEDRQEPLAPEDVDPGHEGYTDVRIGEGHPAEEDDIL